MEKEEEGGAEAAFSGRQQGARKKMRVKRENLKFGDNIKVKNFQEVEEGKELHASGAEVDIMSLLEEMGFQKHQIMSAIDSCGREYNASVIADFIQEHLEDKEKESNKSDSCNAEEGEELHASVDIRSLLEEMGFQKDQILSAIDACGKDSDVSVIADFIHQHLEYKEKGKKESDLFDVEEGKECHTGAAEGDIRASLEEMGFQKDLIMGAINSCGMDCDVSVIMDFIQKHLECKDKAKNESDLCNELTQNDTDDSLDSTDIQLQGMGFEREAIRKAKLRIGCDEFDKLLDCLLEEKNCTVKSSNSIS